MSRLSRFAINKTCVTAGGALRAVLTEAARSVPHYRDLFELARIEPRSVRSLDALGMLPVTSRKLLAEPPYTRFLRQNARLDHLYASHTSGSTGTPATIFMSRPELNFRRLLLFRAIRKRFPWCLPLRVTDVGQMTTQKVSHLTQRLGPIRLTRVPGNLPIEEQVGLYIRSTPQLLQGYAGCLELLAQELSTGKHYPRPRWLISRGEVLTPTTRQVLEEVFDCPVADFYNSEEIGNMAWDCPDQPGVLHVNTDACVLELLDERDVAVPVGVAGRVIVTNLYNCTMPFIRYDIGDHATWDNALPHHCSCGAATPTLASIDGRTDDFIILPDSRRVSPLVVLTAVLNGCARTTPEGAHVAQVYQFQLIQERVGEADVRVVPYGSLPPGLDERIREELRKLHPEFQVHVSTVESIQAEPSGKLKRIICRAAPRLECGVKQPRAQR